MDYILSYYNNKIEVKCVYVEIYNEKIYDLLSEKKKASNRKWDANNLDRMSYTLPKGQKATVQAAAAAAGETVNVYTQRALLLRMGLPAWPVSEMPETGKDD